MILKQPLKRSLKGSSRGESSFTLLELLLVIGIISILAAVVIFVLNPVEYFKRSRDVKRLSEINALNTAIGLYDVDIGGSLGLANTVYVSLPSNQTNCSDLGLPSLPSGWSYSCKPEITYRNVNSTGWIPLNFTLVSSGAPLSVLPIDPINTTSTGNYYTYVTGGSWHLTMFPESERYKLGGSNDKSSVDGGSYPELYEIGTNLTLHPVSRDSSLVGWWRFNEGTGTTAYDSSGRGNNGTLTNGPTWTSGKVGGALSFNGTSNYITVSDSSSLSPSSNITMAAWVYRNDNDTVDRRIIFKNYSYILDGSRSFGNTTRAYVFIDTAQNVIGSLLSQNNWVYVAAIYDSSAQKFTLYHNGIKISETSRSGLIDDSTNSLIIGSTGSGDYFNGFIDEVRIYNRALSAAEISAIYNATK